MLKDVVEVRPLGGYRVHVRFEDGMKGELDLGCLIDFKGIFAPLRDEREFAKVHVHPELGTLVWPNGADLDPDVLYSKIAGQPIEVATGASRIP